MCGVFAEFERAMIVERVRSGLARAKAQGTKSGRAIGRPRVNLQIEHPHPRRSEGRSWHPAYSAKSRLRREHRAESDCRFGAGTRLTLDKHFAAAL